MFFVGTVWRWLFGPRHEIIRARRIVVEHIVHRDSNGDDRLFLRTNIGPPPECRSGFDRYAYFCPHCGRVLADGPEGGCAVNQVCGACNINYGNLPYYPA